MLSYLIGAYVEDCWSNKFGQIHSVQPPYMCNVQVITIYYLEVSLVCNLVSWWNYSGCLNFHNIRDYYFRRKYLVRIGLETSLMLISFIFACWINLKNVFEYRYENDNVRTLWVKQVHEASSTKLFFPNKIYLMVHQTEKQILTLSTT